MDKEWRFLEFDSNVLKLKVASVNGCVTQQLERVLDDCVDKSIDLVYYSPVYDGVPTIEKYPGVCVAETLLFEKKIVDFDVQACLPLSHTDVRIESCPKGPPASDLYELGFLAGEWSRFKVDPSLSDAQYEAMYAEWVRNSTQRIVADEVFVAYNENVAVGLLTIKQNSFGLATIGLLSVAPTAQRTGLGTALMQTAALWAFRARCTRVQVATQGANAGARGFYEKHGFSIVSSIPFYHFWLNHNQEVPQNVPYFTGNEMQYLRDVVDRQRIESCGLRSVACQQLLKDTLGTELVLLTGSGTSALEQAAILCDFNVGDEVIMPSYTFVSTASAFVLRGAVPVFVDVRPDTLNIDEAKVQAAITSKTKALVVVHYAGIGCEMDSLVKIAKDNNLILIEDAAHAVLGKYKGQHLGTFGDFGCLSFHYTKNIICGEGGALVVNNKAFVERSLVVWEKGTNRFEFLNRKVDKYQWVDLGSSFVPSEINASFLLAQLERGSSINARRMRVCMAYHGLLSPLQEEGLLRLMPVDRFEHNGHIFWVVMPSEQERNSLRCFLAEQGVQGYSHYVPLHLSPAGVRYGRIGGDMKCTIAAGSRLLRLPLWPHMTWVHVYRVVHAIYAFAGKVPPSPTVVTALFSPPNRALPPK